MKHSSVLSCPSIIVLALMLSSTAARAQTSIARSDAFRAVTGPIHDGGTYHIDSGLWTRHAQSADLGPDVLYNNTCPSGYHGFLSGDTYIDEGRLPDATTMPGPGSLPGCAPSYAVNGFQIAYCTDQPALPVSISFFNHYVACASATGSTLAGSVNVSNLPGSPASAPSFCWLVDIDLGSSPITIQSNGGALFGWSFSVPLPASQTMNTGPLIAGNFNTCSASAGTSWSPTPNPLDAGTGWGTLDQFRIEGGPSAPGCYFYGGTPMASFHLRLYGATCAADLSGQGPFCTPGSQGNTNCPCANNPPAGSNAGCLNSSGLGAKLVGTGLARISADSVTLVGTQMPATSSCLYLQGSNQFNGGGGAPFGDGVRCAGGSLVRLGSRVNVGGNSQFPSSGSQLSIAGGVTTPGLRVYQIWYRNNASFCTAARFNMSNGWQIYWAP